MVRQETRELQGLGLCIYNNLLSGEHWGPWRNAFVSSEYKAPSEYSLYTRPPLLKISLPDCHYTEDQASNTWTFGGTHSNCIQTTANGDAP